MPKPSRPPSYAQCLEQTLSKVLQRAQARAQAEGTPLTPAQCKQWLKFARRQPQYHAAARSLREDLIELAVQQQLPPADYRAVPCKGSLAIH